MMFYYFGRKGRLAKSYPAPEYDTVIEPFAGSMAYTLQWRPERAIGIERDPETHALWHRLVGMTADELRDFPAPVIGERTYDRWVINGATSNSSPTVKYRTVNKFILDHYMDQRRMALKHHEYARTSVLYSLGDYRQAPDIEATWFIDPPYEGVQNGYKHNHRGLDYTELAEWCMTRRGQVIVCEGSDGSWLPFDHHTTMQGMPTFEGNMRRQHEFVLVRRTHAQCDNCSTTFPASRSDARFCSARCRQAGSRKSRNT